MAKGGRKGKGQRTPASSGATAQPASEGATAIAIAADMAENGEASTGQRAAAAPPQHAERGSGALSSALIAAFLLLQLVLPLRYYLGGRGYDERFSWRMFSSVRMQRCKIMVHETPASGEERKLDMERELQVAWIGMLERYRPQVVERLLRRRCAERGTRSVRYERTCHDTDGSRLPTLYATLDCAGGAVQTREVAP